MDFDRVIFDALKYAHSLRIRIDILEAAIREHAAQEGDDRCWKDDLKLYKLIGIEEHPGLPLPKDQFLTNCSHYWDCQQTSKGYLAPRPICKGCGSVMVCTDAECG